MINFKQTLGLLFSVSLFFSCSNKNNSDLNIDHNNGSGENNEYKLVWEDTFSGTALNRQDWNIEIDGNGGGNNELQYYREENISLGKEPVSGKNCLIITAKKEKFGNKEATSGRLTTQGKKFFKYGKIEASIKLPKTADGLWPAFWMLGNDYKNVGWPKSGEIDILEMGHANGIKNNTQDRYFNGALHWGQSWNGGAYPNYANAVTVENGIQDDFHLFTCIWDDSTIKMYLDLDKNPEAAPYFQMSITNKNDLNSPGHYFHKEFFILLNLAVGGNFPNIHNINNVTALKDGPAHMYIDFVKVYQRK
ncbi:glycoside hydrolase family 16 protein [Sphingobacterium sp. Mn56C]|uniref:glycoside hydrolase family 16 protein n=1 Tax=Sphingobacterium sp. Mn56C TaxID=3395261 RepID=UPI003BE392E3